MKITRKNFIKASSLIAGGFLLPNTNVIAKFIASPSGFRIIRDNIGIYTERGGTIGWFISDDAVVVVDSQYEETAKNFVRGVKQKTQRNIDLLFNTHHHGDHTNGNIYLKDFTSIIAAHENCVELQKKFYGNNPDKPQAYANVTFRDEWTFDLGKEKLYAKHYCAAHTGGDAVIQFVNSNVVHMGDLVFNKTFPFIDLPGGASLNGWIEFLEKAATHFSKDTIYIFGHAASTDLLTGSQKDLYCMRDYITALLDFVSKEIKNGKTKEEVAASTEIPGVVDIKEQREGMKKMNLERAYEYLTTKQAPSF